MSFDHARQYLARVLAWPQEGDPEAWVNIHYTFKPKDLEPGRKLPWAGRAVKSVDEAIKAIDFALKQPDAFDIYACLSTQREAQAHTTQKGWTYHKPVRLAENAVALKSIWLDLDAKGGDKSYASQAEAIGALNDFVKATSLPKPSMIVGSGGGFHVYWIFSRALTPNDWYPIAAALAEATTRHGLKVDSLSTDAARVLRVPNTWNYKTDPKRPVRIVASLDFDYSVEKIQEVLAPYRVEGALPAHLQDAFGGVLPRLTPLKGDSDLGAGIETAMPQLEIRACLDAIPNVNTDWNAWNNIGLRVYAACEGKDYGREEWQRWSDQVADEGKDSVESRWATFQSSPPTRTGAGALINQVRAVLKDPQWQPRKATAPLSALGNATLPTGFGGAAPAGVTGSGSALVGAAPPIVIDQSDMPQGYRRDAMGLVSSVSLDDDGKTVTALISDYPLMPEPWLQRDPWLLHFTTATERGKEQQIALPLSVVGTNEMRKVLQEQGFMLRINPKLASEFFVSWIQKLQEIKDTVSSSPFGWSTKRGTIEGFVYGGQMFVPGGTKVAANPDPVIAKQYAPTGGLQEWLDAAKLITDQQRPALDAILASAFAGPLVHFTGHLGLLMSAYSQESGIGKSTVLKVAQSVWGSPVKAIQMLTDTQNSVMNKIGEIRSLPMYWDELKTEEDSKRFVDIVFRMSLGKEKSRMTQAVKQREVGDWATLLVSASNDSLVDVLINRTSTTTAGLHRVFEFQVTPGVTGQVDISVASRTIAKLHHNYGQAGLIYARFLGDNFARIDAEMGDLLIKLNTEVQTKQEERNWVALIGCILLGARYAAELELATVDEVALKEFLLECLEKMRAERMSQPVDMKIAMNVSDKLAQFLNAMRQRHTIITNRIHITAGKPAPNSIKVMHDASRLDGIYVHVGTDDKLIRISSTWLSQWCEEKGYSRHIFSAALENEFGCKKVRGRIASGTIYAGVTEYLLEIDLAGSKLLDFIGEQ
jgi:hypothetical protein